MLQNRSHFSVKITTGITTIGQIYLGNFPYFRQLYGTGKTVIKAKIWEISKKLYMRKGGNISLQNVGVSRKMRET